MNTLVQINDYLIHAPTGVVAMLFSIALGYVLKSAEVFPNKRIPLVVVPLTAVMYALMQLSEDIIAAKPHAFLYLLLNFPLGFVYGFLAWIAHAQLLRRFVDPKLFNDDGSTKFLRKSDTTSVNPPAQPADKP